MLVLIKAVDKICGTETVFGVWILVLFVEVLGVLHDLDLGGPPVSFSWKRPHLTFVKNSQER